MAKTRRRFTAEFKSKVALEAIKESKTMAELTQEYGVHSTQIKEWKDQLLSALPKVFDSGGKSEQDAKQAEEKEGRLYQKIGQLNVEIDWLKKRWASENPSVEMKKKHLEPTNKKISLRRQCILLGLSWSTFMFKSIKGDKWQENEILNQQLKRQMDEFQLKFPWFGVESYHTWLEKHFKMTLNVKRIRRLMREMGLVSLAPGPHTSTPHPGHKTYPYLLRNLSITYPNQVWCADITYLPMAKGHMYLVAVMDWYSRKVLSWRISNTMEEAFCIDALREAIAKYGKPLIFNTDQGSQFTGENWIGVLKHHEINISMDGKGRALDNVMIERLWRSYKYEYLYLNSPENGRKLKEGTENWINFYNKNRFHQTLDKKTPDQVYQEVHSKVAA